EIEAIGKLAAGGVTRANVIAALHAKAAIDLELVVVGREKIFDRNRALPGQPVLIGVMVIGGLDPLPYAVTSVGPAADPDDPGRAGQIIRGGHQRHSWD